MASSFPYLSSLQLSLFMINSLIIFDLLQLTTAKSCPRSKPCSQSGSLDHVRFPFRISNNLDHRDDQDLSRCVYPGFNLSCNTMGSNHETMISLPTGDFAVNTILYQSQMMRIDDPSDCLPRRFLEKNFSLAGTPFAVENLGSFTFLKCTSNFYYGWSFQAIPCMSGEGYTVAAVPSQLNESVPSFCSVMATVSIPVGRSDSWWLDHNWEFYLRSSIRLTWDKPRCSDCEMRGKDCRFIGDSGSEIGCFGRGKSGLSKKAQISVYIIIFIAIMAFFVSNLRRRRRGDWQRNVARVLSRNHSQTSAPGQTTTNNNSNNTNNVAGPGLDATVIESYPKTVVGESRRLLNSNYTVCPICLAEYRSNDTLRTLPDCFHYFHSDCIDEWLRLNATCPLCRNSPLVSPYPPRTNLA